MALSLCYLQITLFAWLFYINSTWGAMEFMTIPRKQYRTICATQHTRYVSYNATVLGDKKVPGIYIMPLTDWTQIEECQRKNVSTDIYGSSLAKGEMPFCIVSYNEYYNESIKLQINYTFTNNKFLLYSNESEGTYVHAAGFKPINGTANSNGVDSLHSFTFGSSLWMSSAILSFVLAIVIFTINS
ncbi:hypothetical protein BDF19DRAFT_412448 [Syncephalis fuscata]|nr:hypothetical protein BDF19DRAFT_412448 [Syncephalis fuscata]